MIPIQRIWPITTPIDTWALQDAHWLFFDMGNTLISEEASTACRIQRIADALSRHGLSHSIEDIAFRYRAASEQFAPRLGPTAIEMLTDDLELRKLVAAEASYPREMEFPFDGALETLQSLSGRYKIGVIANQTMGSKERLTRWGLMPFVSVCIASAEVGIEKPDPAIFDLALREASCAATDAVMIGDRLDNDIRPARLLGWKTVRVLQGPGRFQVPRDSLDEADLTVSNVKLLSLFFLGPLS